MTFRRHKEKRLHEEGIGPEMRSPVEQKPTPQKETPLAGRRTKDTILGGVFELSSMPGRMSSSPDGSAL